VSKLEAVERLLRNLPGMVAVGRLDETAKARALELESRYEASSLLVPVRNLGVRAALARNHTCVLVKDRRFRRPPAPTVYLVEEGGPGEEGGGILLEAGGKSYRIIGQEVPDGWEPSGEITWALSSSFVLFPQRRSDRSLPAFILLPPLPFPELESRREELEIRNIVSASPSSLCDCFLRQSSSLPASMEYATILVGFDVGSH